MTSRRPQIYLHIGPPKTATTFIQDIIWGNRGALSHQGIHLVGNAGELHFLAAMDLRQRPLGKYEDPRIPGSWQTLATAAMRIKSGKALISHEYFSGASKEHIAQLGADLEGADIHIIYTARDLGRQVPAVWQETLKNRSKISFDRFLDETLNPDRSLRKPRHFWSSHDTVAVLRRWSAVTTPDRVHVLTAPASGSTAPDLWSRFASVIEVDTAQIDMSVARSNASLSRAEAEVLRLLNVNLPEEVTWPAYQRQVKRRFNNLANEQPRGERIRIPEQYRDVVLKESNRAQKSLAESGYHVIGDLSDLEVLDSAFGPDAGPSQELIAETAAGLLGHVMTHSRGRHGARETAASRRRRKARQLYNRGRDRVVSLLPGR